jgi:hypothetical protein
MRGLHTLSGLLRHAKIRALFSNPNRNGGKPVECAILALLVSLHHSQPDHEYAVTHGDAGRREVGILVAKLAATSQTTELGFALRTIRL